MTRTTRSACGVTVALGALLLVASHPASGQVVPRCEISLVQGGRFNNSSRSSADLTATNASGRLQLGRKVFFADATSVSGAFVGLGNGASVFDVNATVVQRGLGATVRGAVGPFHPSGANCSLPAIQCGGQNVLVRRGSPPQVLAPGSYGAITLENGTNVTLQPGVFKACALNVGKHVTIQVTGATQSTIDVTGRVVLNNASTLQPAQGTPTPLLNARGDLVKFGANSTVRAFVTAPVARFGLGRAARFTGSACAQTLVGGWHVTVACAPEVASTTTTTTSPNGTTSTVASTTSTSHGSTSSSTTSTSTTQPGTCGDGVIDAPGEECDGSAFGAFTCPTPGGKLLCTADCKIDFSECPEATSSSTTTTIGASTTIPSTTTPTTSSSTTTTVAEAPTLLDFVNGTPGGTCGTMKDSSNALIRNLTCGGLNIGGGISTVVEGPTPDGSTSRYSLSCAGSSCTIGATSTSPAANSATPDCTTTGCFFGTPLPIANGGTSTCVVNTLSSPASGTLNLGTGAASLNVALNSNSFLTGNATQPCPQCSATGSPASPGHGTCDRGANAGGACTSTNSQGLSRDCAPGGTDGSAPLGAIPVNLSPLTTGTSSKSDAGGLMCSGVGQAAGQKGCFGSTACATITENGSPAGPITLDTPTSVTLASVFCIPSTSSVLVNFAANLPGPGATSLPGTFIAHQ